MKKGIRQFELHCTPGRRVPRARRFRTVTLKGALIKDEISQTRDPLLSQLNTEWAQVEVINLINDGSGLGFGIIGGRSTGVVVKTILPGGVADRVSEFSISFFFNVTILTKTI